MYRSADGRPWRATELRFPAAAGRVSVCAVAERGRRWVAVGGVREGRNDFDLRVTWTSTDGEVWRPGGVADRVAVPTCDRLTQSHWRASTGAGVVRVDPNGPPGQLYLTPAR